MDFLNFKLRTKEDFETDPNIGFEEVQAYYRKDWQELGFLETSLCEGDCVPLAMIEAMGDEQFQIPFRFFSWELLSEDTRLGRITVPSSEGRVSFNIYKWMIRDPKIVSE